MPLLAVGAATALVFPLAPTAHAMNATETGVMGPVISPANGKDCNASDQYQPDCNPSGHAMNQLPDGRVLYWSGLEGWTGTPLAAWASTGVNTNVGVLDLRGKAPKFTINPPPITNPHGNAYNAYYFDGRLANNDVTSNDGDLFCGDFNFLPDGRIMLAGGQSMYQDPGVPGQPRVGVIELNGLRNTRVFDPATNIWSDSAPMNRERWYPTAVTQPDGSTLVFSGTRKLIKPIYTDHPDQSYSDVPQLEHRNLQTGEWTLLPSSANKSLPLYARLHLLPDGRTLYNGGGQTFNTGDFKKDAATWVFDAAFDPKTNTWTGLGINDIGGLPLGYRGTGASVMLPISAADSKVSFLSFGGDALTWPGSSLGVLPATLTSVGIGNNAFSSAQSGSLHFGRWYSDGVLLPTGEVLAVNGSTSSELHHPGLELPNLTSEMWNPQAQKWTLTAGQVSGRTYHSAAILLADGRVLVGGHAPPPFMYGYGTDALVPYGFGTGYQNSTFQIFSPPYLFRGKRPVITNVNPQLHYGQTLTVGVDRPNDITKVVMVRNPSTTHLADADQRNVELQIVGRTPNAVKVAVPNANFLPPGPYMLFANTKSNQGEIPSVSRQVFIGTKLPAAQVKALANRAAQLTKAELAKGAPSAPLTPNPSNSDPGVRMPGSEQAMLPGTPYFSKAGRRSRGRHS